MINGNAETNGSHHHDPAEATSRPFLELSEVVAIETEPRLIRERMIALATEICGTDRVWVEGSGLETCEGMPAPPADDIEGVLKGEIAIPMVSGGQQVGLLRLEMSPGTRLTDERLRCLRCLATIAAASELGLRAMAPGANEPALPSEVCDATFLNTFLRYALAQSHRRRESLSLLAIEIDRIRAIEESLGRAQAEAAVKDVGLGSVGILRSSDLVARVGDRIVAVLPGASAKDALGVAETLRSAIQRVCRPNERRPGLTVCVGVAAYPENALDPANLLDASYQALKYIQARGLNAVGGVRPMFHLTPITGVGA